MRMSVLFLVLLAGCNSSSTELSLRLELRSQQREIDELRSKLAIEQVVETPPIRTSPPVIMQSRPRRQYVPSPSELETIRQGRAPIVLTESQRRFWVDAGVLPKITHGDFQRSGSPYVGPH